MDKTIIFIILIAFIIAACIIMLILDSKSKYKKVYVPNPNKLKHDSYVSMFEECYSRETNLQNTFGALIGQKRLESRMNNDAAAFKMLNYYVKEFNVSIDECSQYANRLADSLRRSEYAAISYLITKYNNELERMEKLYNDVDALVIQDTAAFFNTNSQAQNNNKAEDDVPNEVVMDFFAGCNTDEDIEARYRSLAKAFHPDNRGGDSNMFNQLMNEYNKIKER